MIFFRRRVEDQVTGVNAFRLDARDRNAVFLAAIQVRAIAPTCQCKLIPSVPPRSRKRSAVLVEGRRDIQTLR
jgi:hypothetical protein